MRMNRLADTGLSRRLLASSEDASGSDGAIRLPAWEKPLGGAFPAPVRREQVAQRLRQHYLSILVPFTTANPNHMSFSIEVAHLQIGHFRYAQSCAVHRGEHRPVFEVLRRFQQRFDFGLTQNDRQLLLVAG